MDKLDHIIDLLESMHETLETMELYNRCLFFCAGQDEHSEACGFAPQPNDD